MTATDPARLLADPYRARHSPAVRDPAATFVGLALLLMFVVPGRYAIGPSGVRLTTSSALGLVALFTWGSYFLFRRRATLRLNPAVLILLAYAASVVFNASTAYRRPLSQLESSGVLRAGVLDLGALGLALLLAEGTRTIAGLRRLVLLALLGGYLSAVVGMAQKLFRFGYINYWRNLPFLHSALDDVSTSVLLSNRATGTASHPIEYSVALAALIPFALLQANSARTRQAALGHRVGAAALFVGAFTGISRSAFIAIIIVAVLCVLRMRGRQLLNVLGVGVLALAAVQVGFAGTLSTLRYQLLHIGSDNSSKGRTEDYGPVFKLVGQRPWRGIGLGTFNPKQYLFLDNSWLGQLVAGGIIGVVVLGLVILGSLYVGGWVKSNARDDYVREIAHAACVALVVLAVCAYFFDEFSFTQTFVLFFVSIGLIGATWNLTAAPGLPRRPSNS